MFAKIKKNLPPPIKAKLKKILNLFKNNNSTYAWANISYDPNGVADEVYVQSYPEESLRLKKFYNVGAGSFYHKYWTNIDYSSPWYADQHAGRAFIEHDLLKLAPFDLPSNYAEAVYSSHTVEHVTDEAVAVMLKESYRILKPGGFIRITTPDTDLHYRAWRNNDAGFYYWRDFYSHPDICSRLQLKPANEYSLGQEFLFNFASHVSELVKTNSLPRMSDAELEEIFSRNSYVDALNVCTARCPIEEQQKAPGWHINWWNEQKIRDFLTTAGFENIYKSGYGQSLCPAMRDVNILALPGFPWVGDQL